MPIRWSVDPERARALATVEGEFTSDDISAVIRGVAASALPAGFTVLSDHTGVERPITQTQVIGLASLLEELPERFAGVRWAIVSNRPTSYPMMRVLAARAELVVGMEVRVFFDLRRAVEWLDGAEGDETVA
jgi:hypothetical protein